MNKIALGALLFLSSSLTIDKALAESPSEFVMRALNAEAKSPRKRVEIKAKVGKSATSQVIETITPSRMHYISTRLDGKVDEVYVIDLNMYVKTGGFWQRSPKPNNNTPTSPFPSLEPLFNNIQEQPNQTVNGKELRSFTGPVRWQSGRNWNDGRLNILIDLKTGLPVSLTFSGTCGDAECSVSQSISYDPGLTINEPKPLARP